MHARAHTHTLTHTHKPHQYSSANQQQMHIHTLTHKPHQYFSANQQQIHTHTHKPHQYSSANQQQMHTHTPHTSTKPLPHRPSFLAAVPGWGWRGWRQGRGASPDWVRSHEAPPSCHCTGRSTGCTCPVFLTGVCQTQNQVCIIFVLFYLTFFFINLKQELLLAF